MSKLFIKNMVCNRCCLVVTEEIKKLGINPASVKLGEVDVPKPLTATQLAELNTSFAKLGFEILDHPNQRNIERIKKILIEKVQSQDIESHFGLSETLSKALSKDYSSISKLFSQVEGMTIEQFFILQKIEKVKELLLYDQFNLSEIAWKLGYSSVQHLSSQFKKVTGLTPSRLKTMADFKRIGLDEIK